MLKHLVVVLVLIGSTAAAHADAGDRWDGVMIAEQTGGAVLGGAMAGLAGVGLAAALTKEKGWGAIGAVAAGAVIGVPIGTTVGVKLTGDWRGGNGSWLATGGAAAGGMLLLIATAPSYGDKLPAPLAVAIGTITVLAPPILAYHLTTDENADDHAERRISIPLVMFAF